MDSEVAARAEQTTPGDTEPRLTLTELQALLREAAAYERAQRLSVSAQQPVAHPGIDVRIPEPPEVAFATVVVDRPHIWPLAFMVSGCTGLAAVAMAAATGNQFAILAFFAAVAVWGTATYQLVFNRKG